MKGSWYGCGVFFLTCPPFSWATGCYWRREAALDYKTPRCTQKRNASVPPGFENLPCRIFLLALPNPFLRFWAGIILLTLIAKYSYNKKVRICAEKWPSGRRRLTRNQLSGLPFREFESHLLRHLCRNLKGRSVTGLLFILTTLNHTPPYAIHSALGTGIWCAFPR